MTKYKYSLEEVKDAIINSNSIRQALIKLNVIPQGGNYRVINKFITKFNLDISHFTGKIWNKNKIIGSKRPIGDYLSNSVSITSHKLKQRLIKENIKEHKCENCGGTEWLNKPIPLELNHIDGNHENNNLSNLNLLCPNCHALTSNYRGLNKKSNKKKDGVDDIKAYKLQNKKQKFCSCGKGMGEKSSICKECNNKNRPTKITWPPIEVLVEMISKSSFLAVGKQLGISDNAIRKHIKNSGKEVKTKFSHNK